MSKVVKGVGRAIEKVAKGAAKIFVPIASKTGRKILKIVAIAAAVYFGGAALMGAFGSGAAATAGVGGAAATGLSGAAANISAAWTSLGTAGSQLLAGNIGNAASALGSGIGGNVATMGANGTMLVNGAAQGAAAAANSAPLAVQTATPGMSMAPQSILSPAQAAITQATGGAPMLPAPAGMAPAGVTPAASSPGLINGFINNIATSKYTAPALVSGAFQVGGAAYADRQQVKMDQAARNRYNANIGTLLWPAKA